MSGRWARRTSPPTRRPTSPVRTASGAATSACATSTSTRRSTPTRRSPARRTPTSAACSATGSTRTPTTSAASVLPSANLKFNMAEDVVFRFAASQTMTMPDFSALGASSWGSDLNKTGGGGNPNLKPVMSTNFDGNVEWYFMPRGLRVDRRVLDGPEGLHGLRHRVPAVVQRAHQSARDLPGFGAGELQRLGDGPRGGVRAAHRRVVGHQRQLHVRGWQDRAHVGRRHQQPGGYFEGHLQRGCVLREREVLRSRELHLAHRLPDRPVGRQPVLPG